VEPPPSNFSSQRDDPIADAERRTEDEFWKSFDDAAPRILGALLDAVVGALRNLNNVKLDALPRMADFASWVTAAETAIGWSSGAFLSAYRGSRGESATNLIDADIVAIAVMEFVPTESPWEGTASELLTALTRRVGEEAARSRAWPKTPGQLSNRLARLAPALRAVGIERGSDRTSSRRTISLRRAVRQSSVTSVINGSLTPLTPGVPTIPSTPLRPLAHRHQRDTGDAGDGPSIVRHTTRLRASRCGFLLGTNVR
jgi:hypothetical protein